MYGYAKWKRLEEKMKLKTIKIHRYFWVPCTEASDKQILRFRRMRENFEFNHRIASDYLPDVLFGYHNRVCLSVDKESYLRRCWRTNANRALGGIGEDIRDGMVGYYEQCQPVERPKTGTYGDHPRNRELFQKLEIEEKAHRQRERLK
jgi:hypothetical protein